MKAFSGPPKAIGKGLLSNGFIAMLLTERYVAGRSQNSLVTGLARQGAEVSPGTLTGTCAAAGAQVIGGCCRTGPEHIRAVRDALADVPATV